MNEMNIGIVGGGAIGSFLAGKLSTRLNNVYLLSSSQSPHYLALKKNGLRIAQKDGTFSDPISIKTELTGQKLDIIIFTVKTPYTKQACDNFAHFLKPDGIALSLQNGMGLDVYSNYFQKMLFGITYQGCALGDPGVVFDWAPAETILDKSDDSEMIAGLFRDCGIQCSVSDEFSTVQLQKLIINAGINPVCGIFRKKNGFLLESGFKTRIARFLVKRISHEAQLIAKKMKINVAENQYEKIMQVAKNASQNTCSMCIDIKSGQKTEIDNINGFLVARGREVRSPTFFNRFVVYVVKHLV